MTFRSSIVRNAPAVLFLLSVFGLGAAYGFLVHRNKLFPYPFLKRAESAYAALNSGPAGDEPTTFVTYVAGAPHHPSTSRIAAEQPDDWILITGGPYEFLKECPTFGCLAWVVDRDGRVIHHWEADLDKLWDDADYITGETQPTHFGTLGTKLLPDGSILLAFQNDTAFPEGAGLAKFDIDGKLVWRSELHVNHWFTVGPDGTIYAPAHSVLVTPARIGKTHHQLDCQQVKAQTDYIAILNPDGKLRERIDVLDLLVANGYAGLVDMTNNDCDPLHLNLVQYIDERIASRLTSVDAGDLLISLRNINTVLIFSPRTRTIKWIDTGHYTEQHSPRFLPDASLVVFDNKGGDPRFGGARIVRQTLDEGDFSVVAPREGVPVGDQFTSNYAGNIAVAPDGERLLVALTSLGEIVEIDVASGKPLWRYRKLFAAQGYPGAEPDERRSVQTEAFGAYYVDKALFGPVFGHTPDEQRVSQAARQPNGGR
jgi:arylsulfotransferase ASST